METYIVNVHYDYYATVTVEAENEEDAINKAKKIADNTPQEDLEYCDFTDACVIG